MVINSAFSKYIDMLLYCLVTSDEDPTRIETCKVYLNRVPSVFEVRSASSEHLGYKPLHLWCFYGLSRDSFY